MIKPEPSPGPWWVNSVLKHPWVINANSNIPGYTAEIVRCKYRPNAHLIAAAPELLASLKAALATLDDALADARREAKIKPRWDSVVLAYERQITAARSVIKKAEGNPATAPTPNRAEP